MAKKKSVGRPPKFKNKEEMQEKIDNYFKECEGEVLKNEDGSIFTDKNGMPVIVGARPLTMSGLANALGFSSRQSLLNYEGKKEFMDTIMRARARVEQYTEECLFDKNSANGAKFSLANNFEGWKEKQEVEVTEHYKLEDLL
ncbi:MAG: DNA-packaging protein [Tyzzerella sp.]|nr:DNA-packaging protein [Tyzzerella sp.]